MDRPALAVRAYLPVHIRWMMRDDLPAVMEIETDRPDGWLEGDFREAMREKNTIGMVAEHFDHTRQTAAIVGFMVYHFRRSRIDVLNLAVHPDYRRAGIGRIMLDNLKSKLSDHRRNRLRCEVHEGNLPAQLFLRSQGFLAVGIVYGAETGEAVYRFVYRISK